MIKKEVVVHIETNESDEWVKVNALDSDPGYFLLSLGQNRIVVHGGELTEAISTIDFYKTMFGEEQLRRQQAATSRAKPAEVAAPIIAKKGKHPIKEEEGAIVLDPVLRTGPTASELALEKQTAHMKGDTIVLVEKK